MMRERVDMLNGLVEAMDGFADLREMIAGQRDALVRENGFSEESADKMAAALWCRIMSTIDSEDEEEDR